jgi:HAE1 family hydrophobic/amphiphilic exporter-1
VVANGQSQSALQRVSSSFRSTVPQFDVEIDRVKTQILHVTADQVFSTLSSYLGACFVNQFNKFGRTFQVYTQADAQYRLSLRDIENLRVRNSNGDMMPLGTVAKITPAVGPSLISLYNLYPCSRIIGLPALASDAGASARKSIGITVFSGMIASTCLAVLFVPTFFVVVQRFENWLQATKRKAPALHGQSV